MKTKKDIFLLLILCFGFFSTISSNGQISVDVEKDTTYCSDPNTTAIPMNLKINIKNGVEPYTFAWECVVVPYGILKPLTASDILNDSTLISPTIKKAIWLFTENKVKFILHVTDHIGNKVKDSIDVDFSRCAWDMKYKVISINKGDSIWLNPVTPQREVAAYYWEPSYGLSNPDSSATWCKPFVTTDYYLTTVDTFGCSCSNQKYQVQIITTNADPKLNFESNINPFQKGSRVYFNNKMNHEVLVSMFSLDGKLIHQCSSFTDNMDVSRFLTGRGTYIIKISINGNIGVCKYLKF